MCKCCQSCLESCYWHCFEKWFCYDKNIALYEEPETKGKECRAFDNLAFWDSVSVIANRSVVTIQPQPLKLNESLRDTNTGNHCGENKTDQVDYENEKQGKEYNKINDDKLVIAQDNNILQVENIVMRKKSAVEEKIEKRSGSFSQEANRKKTLKERRKSAAGLTLKLDNDFHELPIIRQNSMPKFYLDTPQVNLAPDYNVGQSHILVSPVLPNTPDFNFDLRSIVQIEKEHASQAKPTMSNRSSRLTQVRRKLKPILIKKPSTKSLPDNVNYI